MKDTNCTDDTMDLPDDYRMPEPPEDLIEKILLNQEQDRLHRISQNIVPDVTADLLMESVSSSRKIWIV